MTDPIAIETKLAPDGAQLFRWRCLTCTTGSIGCWLESEARAQENGRLHVSAQHFTGYDDELSAAVKALPRSTT